MEKDTEQITILEKYSALELAVIIVMYILKTLFTTILVATTLTLICIGIPLVLIIVAISHLGDGVDRVIDGIEN